MNVTEVKIPEQGSAARQRRYRQTERGKSNRLAQKRRKTARRYMEREFVAWDGEGYTDPSTGRHLYTMLAHSNGDIITNVNGLPTWEVLEFMLNADTGDAWNIIYGGNYDVNMILKDLSKDKLEFLYHHGKVRWGIYTIEWRPGKQFAVRDRYRKFRMFDVLPFFQRPFVQACDEYLGKEWEYRDQIIAGKKRRGTFTESEMEYVEEYNRAELRLLVRLAGELRERLYRVNLPGHEGSEGIRLTRWDGPGAIATSLFQKYGVKKAIRESPEPVARAARHAYAGGRFEIIRQGNSSRPCYQYDINSAYPAAIQHLPCLAHGHWRRVDEPTSVVRFGLYRIEADNISDDWTRPLPLWYRTREGRVVYGNTVNNWYWTPEAETALEYGLTIVEGWEYEQTCDHQPFWFVPELFTQRAALKRQGDGAHVGIKLGLNSLYGKLAQQVGWGYNDDGSIRIPPYHCIEWAGYVTSACRAQLWRASLLAPDDIIAFETDAVFTRVPLLLDIGSGLGQWEATEYRSLTYLMSGYYFGTLDDGSDIEKSRGVNKGSVSREQAIQAIKEFGHIEAEQTRFITLGQALHQNFSLWQQWVTSPRRLTARIEGKRIHAMTSEKGNHDQNDGWLETWPNPLLPMENGMSKEYDIEWMKNTDYDRSLTRREDEDRDYD